MTYYAVGAYGTNNIGDDAILEGLVTLYPGLIPISHGYCKNNPVPIYSKELKSDFFFSPEDVLIVGGGGLFYSNEAIGHWLDLAQRAKRLGARIQLRSLGFEDYKPDYLERCFELFSTADIISLRTYTSMDLFKKHFSYECVFEPDFSEALRATIPSKNITNRKSSMFKRVGLVTTGSIDDNYESLIQFIRSHPECNFIHIPHSRSQFNWRNNDCLVGEYIISGLRPDFLSGTRNFETLDYCNSIKDIFEVYSSLDAVISYRFHGVIFSDFYELPCAVMRPTSLKQQSALQYNSRAFLTYSFDELDEFLHKF